MPRAASSFKQADLARALRAAKAADLKVSTVEIEPGGKIVIKTLNECAANNDHPRNEWDAVLS